MAIPTTCKPETIARHNAQRLAEQARDAVAGYNSYLDRAARAYADYLVSGQQLDLDYANDWQEGAQRWQVRAAAVSVTLATVTLYSPKI